MGHSYEIVPADQSHVELLVPFIRQADADEIWAASQSTPRKALNQGVNCSTHAWTGVIDGVPACMFGVAPMSLVNGAGAPWMLASSLIEQHATPFLRRSKKCVKTMRTSYNYLVNYVDNRNTKAIEWLQWLGFELSEPQPFGVYGLPFRRFEMRA